MNNVKYSASGSPHFTAGTAQDMNMGADGLFKQAGNQKFVFPEYRPADRTDPAAASFQAVYTAGYMHQPVCAP
jgi:hypothetical protein